MNEDDDFYVLKVKHHRKEYIKSYIEDSFDVNVVDFDFFGRNYLFVKVCDEDKFENFHRKVGKDFGVVDIFDDSVNGFEFDCIFDVILNYSVDDIVRVKGVEGIPNGTLCRVEDLYIESSEVKLSTIEENIDIVFVTSSDNIVKVDESVVS